MGLLSKADIRKLIDDEQIFVDGCGQKLVGDQLQPASFDVTVDKFYIPPKRGDVFRAKVIVRDDSYVLQPGSMVLVTSKEFVRLNSTLGAFVFPKNGDFALKGLLFTNFGHIDPKFEGHLKFTVINMGRDPFRLRAGERIASITLFTLSSAVTESHPPRHAGAPIEAHARILSRDFLDIERRMSETVAIEGRKRDLITFVISFLGTLVAIATIFGNFVVPFSDKISTLNLEVQKLQQQVESFKKEPSHVKETTKQ
jgi:dCTP deaminase